MSEVIDLTGAEERTGIQKWGATWNSDKAKGDGRQNDENQLFGDVNEEICSGQSYCVSFQLGYAGRNPWFGVIAGISLFDDVTQSFFLGRTYTNMLNMVLRHPEVVFFPNRGVLTMRVDVHDTTVSISFYINGRIDNGYRLSCEWLGKFKRMRWNLTTCEWENELTFAAANPQVLDLTTSLSLAYICCPSPGTQQRPSGSLYLH